MIFDAFISYSTKDKPTADAACATLEANGIRCWIAPRDIPAGAEWGGEIVDAIDRCRVMVLVFSSHANASQAIRREVERAFSRGIPVVPLRIEDTMPTKSLAFFMGAVHWLDALTPPLEKHLQRLAESVTALLQPASPGTRAYEDIRAPETPTRPPASRRTEKNGTLLPFIWTGGAALVLLGLAGAAVYFVMRDRVSHGPPTTTLAGPLRAGETTVLDGYKFYDQSGFSFRYERVVGWNSLLGDLLVANQAQSAGDAVFYLPGTEDGISHDNPGDIVKAGILEMPGVSFSQVKSCPARGYSVAWFPVRLGGVYCVRVRDGQSYAKVGVREIKPDRIRFEWAYNPSGRPEF